LVFAGIGPPAAAGDTWRAGGDCAAVGFTGAYADNREPKDVVVFTAEIRRKRVEKT
jgi:hypothetical protein